MEKNILLFLVPVILAFSAAAAEPLRVVSLSPALTELVCALGQESSLVGRSDVCDWPEPVKKLPAVGQFGIPQVERIILLRPHLLLTNTLVNPKVRTPLEKAGIRVEVIPCSTIREYFLCAEKVGALLHAEEPARKLIADGREQLRTIRKGKLPLKILWVVWDSPLLAAGAGSLPDELLNCSGVENVGGNVTPEYFRASREWILTHPADGIVWTGKKRDLKQDRFWSKLPAVQKGRVICDLDQDVLQRPGPRIFEGLKQLREKLEALPR